MSEEQFIKKSQSIQETRISVLEIISYMRR